MTRDNHAHEERSMTQPRTVKRKKLGRYNGQRVSCKATVQEHTTIDYTYGINRQERRRVLLAPVIVDRLLVDHVWVMNTTDLARCGEGTCIRFTAVVRWYRSLNGQYGYTLDEVKDVHEGMDLVFRPSSSGSNAGVYQSLLHA